MDRAVSGRFWLTAAALFAAGSSASTATATASGAGSGAPRTVVELAGVPTRINDSGQISGWLTTGGSARAALYSAGVWRDLGVLPGDQLSVLYDVNNQGAGVGFSFASLQPPVPPDTGADNRWQAVIAPAGAAAIEAIALIAPDSFGYAINDGGTVVGCLNRYDDLFPDPHRAYVYSGGTLTDLHALLAPAATRDFDFTCARDVNASGDVVGEAQVSGIGNRGFLYRNGAVTWLASGASYLLNARAISSSGKVVGEGRLAGWSADHAVVYDVATATIGSLGLEATGAASSRANDVNAAGEVVGAMSLASGERAYLATGGRVVDLNTRLPAGSEWVLQEAFSINARGQIVGRGYQTSSPGTARYFLMEAPAAPPTIGGLIAQVKALAVQRRISASSAALLLLRLSCSDKYLRRGQTGQAAAGLEQFVRDVDQLIRQRRIAARYGEPLIDDANAIIDALLDR
jgi:hypothetical protein